MEIVKFAVIMTGGTAFMSAPLRVARASMSRIESLRDRYPEGEFVKAIEDRVVTFLGELDTMTEEQRQGDEGVIMIDIVASAYWVLSQRVEPEEFEAFRFVVVGLIPGGHVQIGMTELGEFDHLLNRLRKGETLGSITGLSLN